MPDCIAIHHAWRQPARLSLSHSLIALAVAAALWPVAARADDATLLPPVDVSSPELSGDLDYTPLTETGVSALDVLKSRVRTNDTATALSDIAGVNTYSAGGVSGLPVVNGLADDRVRIVIDGMVMNSACPNHMNSPLSYIDPSNVGSAKVLAGITPVSMGGDSIAGTILIDTPAPLFLSQQRRRPLGFGRRDRRQRQGQRRLYGLRLARRQL
jgi:iron complex outermembrane receptor protein